MKKLHTIAILFTLFLSSCVQEEFDKTITFQVDTNGIEDMETLGIKGDFLPNRWDETVLLSDDDKDGIFEITFEEKTAQYGIEFKFVKNNTEFELEDQDNREIVFKYQPETIVYKTTFNNQNSEITRN